jgi:hypothetical protein
LIYCYCGLATCVGQVIMLPNGVVFLKHMCAGVISYLDKCVAVLTSRFETVKIFFIFVVLFSVVT